MTNSDSTYDVLLVGGGVIGLSLAWELSRHGAKVCVADRGLHGQEASWAGAGMIPPGAGKDFWGVASPIEHLAGISQLLHAEWHERLLELTGIDNGYQASGALHVAESEAEGELLRQEAEHWRRLGTEWQSIGVAELSDLEPALAARANRFAAAYYLPQESQLRNPRHAHALVAACQKQGVDLRSGVEIHDFKSAGGRIVSAVTSRGSIRAEQFCLTAGCWTGQVAAKLGLELSVKPIRGQIVLLHGPAGLLSRHVNAGKRYIVPRREGRLLIGSTMEEVGFLKQNTAAATAELLRFAASLLPATADLPIETSWSGLRPATNDGLPLMGRISRFENTWIAAGHSRSGLQVSPGTAVVMRALMLGTQPEVDVSSLAIER